MIKNINIDLLYQPLIDAPPPQQSNLYGQACAGDNITINTWRETWINYTKANKERFKSFADKSIGNLYGINKAKPSIICGSGPSLKTSLPALKKNAESRAPMMVVSCLHNFGLFEDEGFHADYYANLDSGDITIADVFEGRNQSAEHYWAASKGKTLLATTATNPKLFDLWQGEVVLFPVMIPDFEVQKTLQEIERFTPYVSCGGNALGGCLYIAKAIFCSDIIHLVGADFCFDYDNTFHSYKTHYDALGQYILWPDVFGNMRKTWASYLNFKFWFDHIAMTVPGRYVNCSEGLLGAYRDGNLKHFQYMSLDDALIQYRAMEKVDLLTHDLSGKLVSKRDLDLREYFSNPQFAQDLVLF